MLPRAPASPVQVLKPLSDNSRRAVEALKRVARSPATLRAYCADWECFTEWCSREGQQAFPVEEDTIVAFLARSGSPCVRQRLRRRVATIRVLHREWGDPLPTLYNVQRALENIARSRTANDLPNQVQKRELIFEEVIAASKGFPTTLVGLRDRAVLLFGSAIGQRRADIAALRVQDVEWIKGGVRVTVRKSKTDQQGVGLSFLVSRGEGAACPVAALEAWLKASAIEDGPLLRRIHRSGSVDRRAIGGHIVAQVAKEAARLLGYDTKEYGGHSLRIGFVTSMNLAGVSAARGMAQTGHKKFDTYNRYNRRSAKLEDAATTGLFVEKREEETIEVRGQTLVKAPKRRFERDGDAYDARSKVEHSRRKGSRSSRSRARFLSWALPGRVGR